MVIEDFGQKDIMQIQQEKNKKVIEEYIKKQLQEDIATDQMVMKEFVDPFTGEKEAKIKKKKGPFQWQREKVAQLAIDSVELELIGW